MFHSWSSILPAEIEVCAIQLPGRENRLREAPFTQLSPLVQTLVRILHPYLHKPFALFGHSMGALISFELTRELRRRKVSGPLHLFVSGRNAPQIPDPDPIYHLPEPEFVAVLRRLNGTPEAVLQNRELMQFILPLLRADFTLHETYSYTAEPPLDCPISVFGGLQDSETTRDGLDTWRAQTRNVFTLRLFPGDHFFLDSAQNLLLQAILQDLSKTGGEATR